MEPCDPGLSWRNTQGFNLLSVLVGLALTGVVVVLASKGMVASKRAKNSVQAGDRYQQIAAVLQDSLKDFVKTAITSSVVPCGNTTSFFSTHAFVRLDKTSWSATRGTVPSQVNAQAWDAIFQSQLAATAFAGMALNRCPNLVEGTNGRFHFCLKVQRDSTQPKESLLQAPLAFAEVSIQLNDLASGTNVDCATYLDPNRGSTGATVDYVLFWLFENGSQLELKKRTRSFYVNK